MRPQPSDLTRATFGRLGSRAIPGRSFLGPSITQPVYSRTHNAGPTAGGYATRSEHLEETPMGSIRAHTITKTYLSAWADKKNRVQVLNIDPNGEGRGYVASVNNATVVSDAYATTLMNVDLEAEYAKVEAAGVPLLQKLREGQQLDPTEKSTVVDFLDMHHVRGRHSDQTATPIPAIVMLHDGTTKDYQLTLGDRLTLGAFRSEKRLSDHEIETWPWQVADAQNLATGDGAVLLGGRGGVLTTVTFPLSPSQLLVIGDDEHIPRMNLNVLMAKQGRRWIVGTMGSLNLDAAANIVRQRRQG